MKRKTNLIALLLMIVYLAGVGYCCFGHFDDLPQVEKSFLGIPTDKIAHFIMFFPFPIIGYMLVDAHNGKKWEMALHSFLVFVAGCILASGTEIGQSFTDYRSCDSMDLLSDISSLTLSTVLNLIFYILK